MIIGVSDAVYKIVLIGDTGVGKSCLMHRFADDDFCASHVSTIGVDFKVRTVKRDDGKSIKLQLWDSEQALLEDTVSMPYHLGATLTHDYVESHWDSGGSGTLPHYHHGLLSKRRRHYPRLLLSEHELV